MIVVFSHEAEQVQILHILNGAQDVEAILFPDG